MPLDRLSIVVLAVAALMVTGFSLSDPSKKDEANAPDKVEPLAGAHLPAVARIWASLNCENQLPGRDLLVHEDDLFAGADRFENIQDSNGNATACAEAYRAVALERPWPHRILHVSFTAPD